MLRKILFFDGPQVLLIFCVARQHSFHLLLDLSILVYNLLQPLIILLLQFFQCYPLLQQKPLRNLVDVIDSTSLPDLLFIVSESEHFRVDLLILPLQISIFDLLITSQGILLLLEPFLRAPVGLLIEDALVFEDI